MNRDALADHLRFAADLGVAGVTRDPAWRTRPDDTVTLNQNSQNPPNPTRSEPPEPREPQEPPDLDPRGSR